MTKKFDAYKLASSFAPLPGEANFPPPIDREVVGGLHIAPECITQEDGSFVMVDWPRGLPRHDSGHTVRFPHGLMMFGETIEQCAQRLIKDQLGMAVDDVRVLEIDSYLDDQNHWHIEPLLLAQVSGNAVLPSEANGVVRFQGDGVPEEAVWGAASFRRVYETYLAT